MSEKSTHLNDKFWPVLKVNRWFSTLSERNQRRLLEAGNWIRLRDEQTLVTQGQPVRSSRDGFGVLLQGVLKVSSSTLAGREAILNYVWPGQWFGELAVIDGQFRERDFVSMGNSEVLMIEAQQLHELMKDAELAREIAQLLAARTRTLLHLVEDFALRSSLSRTARRLVMLAYEDGPQTGRHRAQLPVSQENLASMLGLTRQSVASQLRELTRRGAIEQSYGRVHISSMVALMAEAAAT